MREDKKPDDLRGRIYDLEHDVKNLKRVTYHPKVTITRKTILGYTVYDDIGLSDFVEMLVDYLGLEYRKPTHINGRLIKKPRPVKHMKEKK